MSGLKDKVVLVTGASSGIGAATVIHFASLGCKVAINGRNEHKLINVEKECLEKAQDKSKVIVVAGDLNEDQIAQDIIQKTVTEFGGLDVLVNNAGIVRPSKIPEASMDTWDFTMSTNLRTPYRLIQLAIPYLVKSKGNIINVSSVAAYRSFPGISAYCASKAALDHMTRNIALELGPQQVRVNCLNPGAVRTDIIENSGNAKDFGDDILQTRSTGGAGRMGEPEEIAKAIAFLASDDASFITGATLVADGGLSLCPPILANSQ